MALLGPEGKTQRIQAYYFLPFEIDAPVFLTRGYDKTGAECSLVEMKFRRDKNQNSTIYCGYSFKFRLIMTHMLNTQPLAVSSEAFLTSQRYKEVTLSLY